MVLHIPSGSNAVKVSVISPNRVLDVPASAFLTPEIKGTAYSDTPCLSFLIQHEDSAGRLTRLLFDLGIRKDWENSPPAVVEAIQRMGIKITTEKDPVDQLMSHGLAPSSIDTVIFSHWHFDHVGDMNRFPSSTKVVVGPGFKKVLLPGYPEDSSSIFDGRALEGRVIVEVTFDQKTSIASLEARDWFGDGSLYLINTPGHAVGHISALARTTMGENGGNDTFVLLAGDVCHHMGELRPSQKQNLPHVHSDYLQVHPSRCSHAPFYTAAPGGFNMDPEQMQQTVTKIQELDAHPDVFSMLAHDNWLLDRVDLFPLSVNGWQSKGWDQDTRWRFLGDFDLQES